MVCYQTPIVYLKLYHSYCSTR